MRGPLSLYQPTECNEGDILRLAQNLKTWAESDSKKVIPATALDTLFKRSWPALKQALEAVRKTGKMVAPTRTADDLVRETLIVVRSLRDEIASLRTEMSNAGIVPQSNVSVSPVEGLFRILYDVPTKRVDQVHPCVGKSVSSFRQSNRHNETLVVTDYRRLF